MMAHKALPIYHIENFNYLGRERDFFTNVLLPELPLIRLPPHFAQPDEMD
jgi:hypothetical protein